MTTNAQPPAAIDHPAIDDDVAALDNQDLPVSEVLPEQIIKNVETIVNHQEQYDHNVTVDQQVLDKIAAIFGQPQFLYFQIGFFMLWAIYGQLVDRRIVLPVFPVFDFRGDWLEVASLFISTGVLIYQNRREKLSSQRSHLVLQINLITEQKITKLISLVEELRIDLPNVKNRNDLEAEMMQQATDAQAILGVLQQNLEQSGGHPDAAKK
jgi:uncharacterized membrane protein